MEPAVASLWASDLQNRQRKPCALLRSLVRRALTAEAPGNANTPRGDAQNWRCCRTGWVAGLLEDQGARGAGSITDLLFSFYPGTYFSSDN